MGLSRYLADLEGQFDQERRDSVMLDRDELLVQERAAVSFAQRIFACRGRTLTLALRGGVQVSGIVMDAAHQWVLLDVGGEEFLIPLAAVVQASPLGRAMLDDEQISLKLSISSVLRRFSYGYVNLVIEHDGGMVRGVIDGVYSDHVDILPNYEAYSDVRDVYRGGVVSVLISGIQKISVNAARW